MGSKRAESNNGTKILIIILILLIIIAGIILGYKIVKDRENKEEVETVRRKYNCIRRKRRNKRSPNF